MGYAMSNMSGILLSGGVDSTALAYWKRPAVAFTVDYGQVCAAGEIRAAEQISKDLGLVHEVVRVDCSHLGSGDLAGTYPLPTATNTEWWPYRNQLLVTLVAMRAIAVGVGELLVGSVLGDQHIDGTAAFYGRLDELLAMQEGGLRVSAPAASICSLDLVRLSGIPRELLAWTHSCHTADFACGWCRGCSKHRATLSDLGYGPY